MTPLIGLFALLGRRVGVRAVAASRNAARVRRGASALRAFGAAAAAVLLPVVAASGAGLPSASDNAELGRLPSAQYPAVIRLGLDKTGDVPPLLFVPSATPCKQHGGVGDKGSCVQASGGGSWHAVHPGDVDARQFGVVAGGGRDNTATFQDTLTAARGGAGDMVRCVYLAGYGKAGPYVFNNEIVTEAGDCIKGDGPFRTYLSFPNDTNGIRIDDHDILAGFAIVGHAATSASSVVTLGLFAPGQPHGHETVQGIYRDIVISNFVIGEKFLAPFSRNTFDNVVVDNSRYYPNLANGFPLADIQLDDNGPNRGEPTVNKWLGGELRDQSTTVAASYHTDGTTGYFDITLPTPGAVRGVPLLWAADGIKVYHQTEPVSIASKPLACDSRNYSIYDISEDGGGGSGGLQLFCASTQARIVVGSARVTVGSTFGYRFGRNIIATANHGLRLGTYVSSIPDSTTLVLSQPAIAGDTITLGLEQIGVGGNNMSAACQKASPPTCGHKLEVRFPTAPTVGSIVRLQWVDPWASAAIDAVDDSHDIFEFYLVGGQRVGFKHETGNGADQYIPSYVELQNQCSSIETGSSAKGGLIEGDVVRVLRSPNLFPFIPDCPGYVSASGRNTVACFNNVCRP